LQNKLARKQPLSLFKSPFLGICLFLSCFSVLFAWGFFTTPEYFADGLTQQNPDAKQYVTLARNIIDRGAYSRHPTGLGEPDMLRTPAYPLFLISTLAIRCISTAFVTQAILVCGLIILTYRIASRIHGPLCGTISAILCGTDLLLTVSCFEAMSEVLFVFLTVLGFDVLRWPFIELEASSNSKARWILGGLILGFSTLVRPSNIYLPFVIVLSLLLLKQCHTPRLRLLKPSVFFLLSFAVLVAPWILRNAIVLGVPKLTTVDKHNLVYFVGAGSYQHKYGWSRQEAQNHIANEFNLPSYRQLQNHWIADNKSVKELYYTVSDQSIKIVCQHPQSLIEASAIGACKATLAHSCKSVAHLTGGKWYSIWNTKQNSPGLYIILGWQLLHTCMLVGLATIGVIVSAYRKIHRPSLAVMLLTLAYYYLIVALFGIDAVARARISCLPVLFILAGLGGSVIASHVKQASRNKTIHQTTG
jgi:4-amino-4-deoxy-L-arabinose transferase-like glycosyltransferase